MLMGFVTIHKGDPIGAAPQPLGVVGMIPLSGGVKDTPLSPKPAEATLGFSSDRKEIDNSPVRRYGSGQKKGGLISYTNSGKG